MNFIWFTDEKPFTVAAPKNSQNDRVYIPIGIRKKNVESSCILRTWPTFTKSLMVSVGVSALGCRDIHFVDPGVKINGQYYCDVMLRRDLLQDIRQFSDFYRFQQDGAPAHRARETVEFLTHETPDFISPSQWPREEEEWPPNSPDLNPVDYKIWSAMQEQVYSKNVRDTDELRERIIEVWAHLNQSTTDCAIKQ